MKRARVLIVDTDTRLRSQLCAQLIDLEVFSDSVANANEALEFLGDERYGLILLDLDLANDEAYSIIDSVRFLQSAARPMILATATRDTKANVDPELVQIVMRKPLRVADAAGMIRSCVGSARNAVTGSRERSDGAIDLLAGDQQGVGVVG